MKTLTGSAEYSCQRIVYQMTQGKSLRDAVAHDQSHIHRDLFSENEWEEIMGEADLRFAEWVESNLR